MSRGKILIQGSPDFIKSNFGIGYELFFRNLNVTKKDGLEETIVSTFGSDEAVDLNLNDFESQKIASLTIPISQVDKTAQFLNLLENKQIEFGLRANTLEEAFVKMGEKEFKTSTNQLKTLENKIEKISKVEYTIDKITQLKVLFLRRIVLMLKIPIQIMVILFVVIFPGFVMMYVIDNSEDSDIDVTLVWREVSSLTFMLTISILCSTFVYLPCYERSNKLRYLLQKMGVNSVKYYLTLFASDFLIGIFMAFSGTIFIFSTFTEESGIDSSGQYLKVVFANLAWMATYITQSYIVSFLFKTIQGSSRIAPLIILLTIVAFPFAVAIDNQVIHWIIFTLFPCPCFLAININKISSKLDNIDIKVNMSNLQGYMILVFSTIFYLCLAMYLDMRNFMSQKGAYHKNAEKKDHMILDRKRIEMERQECLMPDEKYVLQCSSLAKTFKTKVGEMFAIKRLDMTLRPNEILGIIGPNGAGKTTLFNLIGSFYRRSAGDIYLRGQSIEEGSKIKNQTKMKGFFDDVGLCLQEDVFWEDLSIEKHLEVVCDMKGIAVGNPKERKNIIDTWLEALSLTNFRNYKA